VLDGKKGANHDQQVGIDIVRRALQAPVRQIAQNAGHDGAVIAGHMLEQKSHNYGFDAQKGEYVDMIKAGVIDPVKVVRAALQGAASVAGLLITTEAMVADHPDDSGGMGGGMPGGMGGMGGMGGGGMGF
jgi:chaperonin GroEL